MGRHTAKQIAAEPIVVKSLEEVVRMWEAFISHPLFAFKLDLNLGLQLPSDMFK
jgi:hypothetical protein